MTPLSSNTWAVGFTTRKETLQPGCLASRQALVTPTTSGFLHPENVYKDKLSGLTLEVILKNDIKRVGGPYFQV